MQKHSLPNHYDYPAQALSFDESLEYLRNFAEKVIPAAKNL
jgi:hypothetical protein